MLQFSGLPFRKMRNTGGVKHSLGTSTPSMLCCVSIFLAVSFCLQQVTHWGLGKIKVITQEEAQKYTNGREPQALLHPVWWYAPFFSGSGEQQPSPLYVVKAQCTWSVAAGLNNAPYFSGNTQWLDAFATQGCVQVHDSWLQWLDHLVITTYPQMAQRYS